MSAHLSLFGPNPKQIAKATLRVLAGHHALNFVLATATPAERQLIHDLIVAEMAAAGSFDLITLMVAGWRLHRRLVAAARQSLAPPYPVVTVDIGSYHIRSTHPMPIDVIINGAVVAVIDAGLDVDVTVARFKGVVRGGRLIKTRAGTSEVVAELTIDGITVLGAALRFNLSATVPLGSGIALT